MDMNWGENPAWQGTSGFEVLMLHGLVLALGHIVNTPQYEYKSHFRGTFGI